jgi:hypothetical protein
MIRVVACMVLLCMLGLAATLFEVPKAHACSCVGSISPGEQFEKSTAVFAGKVADIEAGDYSNTVHFDVERAWKGVSTTTLALTTSGSSDSSGYDFEKGKEYVVYAYSSDESSLRTSTCSRTQLVAYAYDDLAYLGAGYTPAPGQPATVAKEPGDPLLPFIGIGAAVTAAIVLFTRRKSKRQK